MALAHELGHIQNYLEKVECFRLMGSGAEFPKKICRKNRWSYDECLYEELRASYLGIKILENTNSKSIDKLFSKKEIARLFYSNFIQQKKCLAILEELPQECPVFEDIKILKMQIKSYLATVLTEIGQELPLDQ